MFTSAGHLTHCESLLIRHGQNQECFTCLIEILEDANISMVQREMCLSFLKSVVDENETFLQVLPSYRLECCNIICVLTDMYTEDPHKLTAALLCASMIDKLQDEHLYEIFMDKFQDVVLSRLVEKHSQFYFIVLSKLCEFSKTYSQMIVSFHGNIILTVLETHHCFDEDTLSWLVSLLKLLIPILCSNCGLLKEGSDLFLWKILEVLVVWMNTVHSSELQVNILFLLRECLQSEEMISGLLLIGSDGSVDCSLLMGLKRILASKNSMIIVPGTQCLTLLMEKLTEPALVKEVLDTDLAEIVFEFLHSTIPSQLESTFQCLQAMVQHQYFFEKCHAVYGLDSILKSIKDALDTGKTIILIKGLELLTSLLVRQPESMPLFMNQSWSFCITLLHTAIQYETPAVFVKALKAVEQFMRPQHQQTPLAVRSITSLLSTVYYYYEHHLKSLTQSGQGQQAYHMTSSIINIVVITYRLSQADTSLVGNETEWLKEMENCTKVFSKRLTIILTTNLCEYLHDESRFREFLFCLDILVSGDSDSSISNSAQLMASGIPLHLLGYLPQSNMSVEMQDLLGNIISSMCLHLTKMILPSLQINKRMLTLGMSKISCVKLTSLQPVLDRLSSREEITAVLTLLYFSYLHQYRYWDNAQLLNFLTKILRRHPDIFSYESIVIRALVYLLSCCQLSLPLVTDCYSEDIEKFVLLQLEKTPIDVWFTDCLIVYKWCLLTQERTATLGTKLVEYWLTQIDITHCSDSHMLDSLSENNKMLLDDMKFHFQFLMSLLNHLSSESISSKARNVFVYCISKLTHDDMSLVNAVHKLFVYATRSFETSYLQNTTANVAENFLCVMNALLNCQLSSTIDRIICVKSVYLVLKLITKGDQTLSTVTNGLQFLSSVTQGLTFQDSKTVIPPILQNERFLTILEKSVTQQDATISQPSLVLVSWLAFHDDGIQIQRSVRISSDYLLRGLAMCKTELCVPLIKLIDVALSKKQGAVTFYKCQPNYKSTQIFSFRELKQIYLYLQQFILQENLDVRCSVVNCIEKLLAAGPEIKEYILYQAWNIQMLESVLASRKLHGLTEAELTLCCLFSSKVTVWSSIALDSFLMALINTDLLQDHGHKAIMFMQKIKKSINFDNELLQLAELHLNEVTIQNK